MRKRKRLRRVSIGRWEILMTDKTIGLILGIVGVYLLFTKEIAYQNIFILGTIPITWGLVGLLLFLYGLYSLLN